MVRRIEVFTNPRMYKPRVCILCETLEKALKYTRFIKRKPVVYRLEELVYKIDNMKRVTDGTAIIVIVDRVKPEITSLRILRLIDPYVPVVIVMQSDIESLRQAGHELDCIRVLV